jgi:hypothetical protein
MSRCNDRDVMTAEQRLNTIAGILATGVLRLRRHGVRLCGAEPSTAPTTNDEDCREIQRDDQLRR